MKFPGTPATRLNIGVVNPKKDSAKSPRKQPIAAPNPPIKGPKTTVKKAGITTPGLKCPIPHGVGIGDVTAIATA